MPSPTNPLLLNYHFDVHFHRRDLSKDHRFQSVQGLHAQILPEDLAGKKNATFDNVKLTRAYEPDSKLVAWCMDAINNKVFKQSNVTIKLLNSKHEMQCGWKLEKAIPVGWGVEELDAENCKVLIETIELKYEYFEVINSRGEVVSPKPRT